MADCTSLEDPPRPSRKELAEALASMLTGEPFTVNRSIAPPCVQFVKLASGWRLAVWWLSGTPEGSLGPLAAARSPDGRRWVFGCDRWPDWDSAEQALVLDPLQHLITPLERASLEELLRSAVPVKRPEPAPVDAPAVEDIWTEAELEVMGGG